MSFHRHSHHLTLLDKDFMSHFHFFSKLFLHLYHCKLTPLTIKTCYSYFSHFNIFY